MKKKLLIFIPVFLPGIKAGGPIRSIEALVYYLKDVFDIYIFTSDRDIGDEEPYRNVELDKWIDCKDYKIYYSHSKKSFKELANIINSIDPYKIYLNTFFNYNFSIKLILMSKLNFIKNKIVLAPRGEFSQGALNIKKLKKMIYITISKIFELYNNVEWHASTELEKKDILEIFPESKVKIALNLSKPTNFINKQKKKEKNKLDLVFISRISPKKNLKFALEVLKYIDKNEGEINFDIYGPLEDQGYWRECLKVIKSLPSNIKVNYKGALNNEEVIKMFSKYHFFFFPTLGENFGHVIKESFMAGTPVIISDQTPWKNLEKYNIGYCVEKFDIEKYLFIIKRVVEMEDIDYQRIVMNIKKYVKNFFYNDSEDIKKTIELFI